MLQILPTILKIFISTYLLEPRFPRGNVIFRLPFRSRGCQATVLIRHRLMKMVRSLCEAAMGAPTDHHYI